MTGAVLILLGIVLVELAIRDGLQPLRTLAAATTGQLDLVKVA